MTYMKMDAEGNVIFSDNGFFRKVTPAGTVTTFADSQGVRCCGVWGAPVAVDSAGDLFTVDAIWDVSTGTGYATAQELSAAGASINIAADFDNWSSRPFALYYGVGGIELDQSGNLYFADSLNNRIMKVTPAGAATVFAGTGAAGFSDGSATTASFDAPGDIAIDPNGNFLVADDGNNAIRKITPDGTVSTYATGLSSGVRNVAVDKFGNCYAAAPQQALYNIALDGTVTTIPVGFSIIMGLAADGNGNLYTKAWVYGVPEILRISVP